MSDGLFELASIGGLFVGFMFLFLVKDSFIDAKIVKKSILLKQN
jgi:hypothetical protein